MTAGECFVTISFVVVVAFVCWCWAMNRWDERQERRTAERFREPPVLGGGWERDRWPDPGAQRHRRR